MPDRVNYNGLTVIQGGALKLGDPSGAPSLSGGGGDGTSGGMTEARVAQLEADMRDVKADTRRISDTLLRIEGKLDTKASAMDTAEIKGKLDAKASAADVSLLSGKIDDRPTTWKVVTIVIGLGILLSGSQFIKTVVDAFHPAPQITKAP